jgi:hypothetical protein
MVIHYSSQFCTFGLLMAILMFIAVLGERNTQFRARCQVPNLAMSWIIENNEVLVS